MKAKMGGKLPIWMITKIKSDLPDGPSCWKVQHLLVFMIQLVSVKLHGVTVSSIKPITLPSIITKLRRLWTKKRVCTIFFEEIASLIDSLCENKFTIGGDGKVCAGGKEYQLKLILFIWLLPQRSIWSGKTETRLKKSHFNEIYVR